MDVNPLCHFNVLEAHPVESLGWGWAYAGRLEDYVKRMVDWLRRAHANKSVDFAPEPQAIDKQAAREGLREIAPPVGPPKERVHFKLKHNSTHKFPQYGNRAAPNWGPRRPVTNFFRRDQQRQPGNGAQDRGRQAQHKENNEDRYRASSRSRSPQLGDNRGRAPSRDRRYRGPRNYDRSASRRRKSPSRQYGMFAGTYTGANINQPTLNANELRGANNVVHDGLGTHQLGNYANPEPQDRDRGYFDHTDRDRDRFERGGGYERGGRGHY